MSHRSHLLLGTAATALLATVACSSASSSNGFNRGGATGGSGGQGGNLFDNEAGVGGSGGGILPSEPPCNPTDPSADSDGDGWTTAGGDCNDCTAQMNPGAFDYANNGVDEDCNGTPDDEPTGCDQGLAIEGNSAMDAAKSLGLCRVAQGESWGVVSATWSAADGTKGHAYADTSGLFGGGCDSTDGYPSARGHGLLPKFGKAIKPRQGASMLALSSGTAREGTNGESPAGDTLCTQSNVPPAPFAPKTATGCNVPLAPDYVANDVSALEIVIKTPTNANSFSFAFDFYTYEWPDYVCSQYNDYFAVILQSNHPKTPADHNISFDSQGNPVSVNNGLVQVCDPQMGLSGPGGKTFSCPLGTGELAGTGFEKHAASSWLQTKAPVVPGETIHLRFAVWDMGDEFLDSTVVIDDFAWDVAEGTEPTTVPIPK